MPFALPGLRWSLAAMLLMAIGLEGCATPPDPSDPDAVAEFRQNNDPIEPTNRVFFAINNGLDTVLLAPVARGYRAVVPEPVRNGIHNVLANLSSPVLFIDDVMQTRPRRAGDTLARFVINTTVGVGGIFDPADKWGWHAHDNDSGITLALWGVPDGPFLFLPVLGPSNPRDAAGFGADIGLDPFTYTSGATWRIFAWTRYGVSAVDARERHLDDIEQIKRSALDPYATFRSLYQQHRAQVIDNMRDDEPATVPAWFKQRDAAPGTAPGTAPGIAPDSK